MAADTILGLFHDHKQKKFKYGNLESHISSASNFRV